MYTVQLSAMTQSYIFSTSCIHAVHKLLLHDISVFGEGCSTWEQRLEVCKLKFGAPGSPVPDSTNNRQSSNGSSGSFSRTASVSPRRATAFSGDIQCLGMFQYVEFVDLRMVCTCTEVHL
jgi:hypothetical protein